MNVYENTALVLMEECAELQQAISKTMRFGLANHHPDNPQETNQSSILKEFYQLEAMMEYFLKENKITIPQSEIDKIKKEKISKFKAYREYSTDYGFVSNEDSTNQDSNFIETSNHNLTKIRPLGPNSQEPIYIYERLETAPKEEDRKKFNSENRAEEMFDFKFKHKKRG